MSENGREIVCRVRESVGYCKLVGYRTDTETNVSKVPPFTGEEKYGRYLDLHEFHQRFINFKDSPKIDYFTFLGEFYSFKPKEKYEPEYKKYLADLFEHLISFLKRSQPLLELDKLLKDVDLQFEKEMEALEQLKDPLMCDACNKKFAKDTVFQAHLSGKKHLKNAAKVEVLYKDCLRLEAKISALCQKILMGTISDTKVHVEKKLSRRPEEQGISDDEEMMPIVYIKEPQEEEDESEIVTTKKNYPVGWDGKPIPYWLYKLHGLGVEYKCEICGNASYYGRKAFEMHFQEWRHAHSLKCLGIPNTRVFRDVTKINDALILWEKMKRDTGMVEWRAEIEEEFEDNEGHVFNRKIYDDLRAQGLL